VRRSAEAAAEQFVFRGKIESWMDPSLRTFLRELGDEDLEEEAGCQQLSLFDSNGTP